MPNVKTKRKDSEITVIINRKKWLTADVSDLAGVDSTLYSNEPNTKGFQCCLGFACNVAGISKQSQTGKDAPGYLYPEDKNLWMDKFGNPMHISVSNLVSLNDDSDLYPSEREKGIHQEGKKLGINFVFRGKYPKLKVDRP